MKKSPHADKIADLAALGIFAGTGETFKPYDTLSRAEYMRWVYKSHNALAKVTGKTLIQFAPDYDPQFKDLSKDHPDYKYIQALANSGYSVGYEDGTFKPERPISREEMISIKVALDKGLTFKPARGMMDYAWGFSDGKEVDERYTGYIYQDVHAGCNICRTFGKIKTFRPKKPVQRYEAAATLWSYYHTTTAAKALKELGKS